jgi:hypothetical protein
MNHFVVVLCPALLLKPSGLLFLFDLLGQPAMIWLIC